LIFSTRPLARIDSRPPIPTLSRSNEAQTGRSQLAGLNFSLESSDPVPHAIAGAWCIA
jgi:hypothetical protein